MASKVLPPFATKKRKRSPMIGKNSVGKKRRKNEDAALPEINPQTLDEIHAVLESYVVQSQGGSFERTFPAVSRKSNKAAETNRKEKSTKIADRAPIREEIFGGRENFDFRSLFDVSTNREEGEDTAIENREDEIEDSYDAESALKIGAFSDFDYPKTDSIERWLSVEGDENGTFEGNEIEVFEDDEIERTADVTDQRENGISNERSKSGTEGIGFDSEGDRKFSVIFESQVSPSSFGTKNKSAGESDEDDDDDYRSSTFSGLDRDFGSEKRRESFFSGDDRPEHSSSNKTVQRKKLATDDRRAWRRREGTLVSSIHSEPTPSTVVREDSISKYIIARKTIENKKRRTVGAANSIRSDGLGENRTEEDGEKKAKKKRRETAASLSRENSGGGTESSRSCDSRPTGKSGSELTLGNDDDEDDEDDDNTDGETKRNTPQIVSDDECEYEKRYEEEGEFLGFVGMEDEEEKMKEAKSEIDRKRKETVLRSLMHINQSIYCDDIEKDRDEARRLDDQKHTDRLRELQTDKLIYADAVVEKLNEEGLLTAFKDTETVRMWEEYAKCHAALSDDAKYKDVGPVTKSKNLPLVTAKYAQKYLREPIADLGERPCLSEKECLSVYLYKVVKGKSSLVSTATTAKNAQHPDSYARGQKGTDRTVDNGSEKTPGRGTEWLRGSQKTSDYIRADKRDEGFVLREFLLPDEERSIAEQVRLGTPYKEVYRDRKKKFCLLCNRYFTSLCTSRIMAAMEECPKNAVHDHVYLFGIVGEYTEKSILNHGEGPCGVIDRFVSWDTNDYVPGTTTVEYATISGKEKVSLGCWIQRNIVKEKNSHDRHQGRFSEVTSIENVVAEYPKTSTLLKKWYPIEEFYLYAIEKSKFTDEGSNSTYDRPLSGGCETLAIFGSPKVLRRRSRGGSKKTCFDTIWNVSKATGKTRKKGKEALGRKLNLVWHDDISETAKDLDDLVNFLYGRSDALFEKGDFRPNSDRWSEETMRWFFPYWCPYERSDFEEPSEDLGFAGSAARRLRLALLVRINFALAVRDREYESLERSWSNGPGAYGVGSFYDYSAYAGFNVSEQKKSTPHGRSNFQIHQKNGRGPSAKVDATSAAATNGEVRDYFSSFEMESSKPKRTRLDILKEGGDAFGSLTEETFSKPARDVSSISHRLFKLNVFLETNRRIYVALKGDSEASCARTRPSETFPSTSLPKVPKRRCRMDEKFVNVTRETVRTHEGLKTSLEFYESLLFEEEIANEEWDGFYREDVGALYEFFKKRKASHLEKREKFVSQALFTTDNVELFHAVGVGYDPRRRASGTSRDRFDISGSHRETTPLYDVDSDEPMKIYGTDKSLLVTVLYVVCACERIANYVKKKYASSLSHPSRVVEWFGTTASKTGAFPAFIDEKNDETDHREPVVRKFDKDHPFSKQNGKTMQKTTQSVYEKQIPGQMTKDFYDLLEKYLFCLHAYRMSFLSAMLYYKRAKKTREIRRAARDPGTSKSRDSLFESIFLDSPNFGRSDAEATGPIPTTDDRVPYAILFPFDGTDWSGEEGLRFLTHHKLPDISKIVKQVAFWSKGSGQDNVSAIAYAFQKSLTYRSQCRDTAKKTVDTCKNHPTVYEYFRFLLFLTFTGGYERYFPPTFSPSVESKISDVFGKSKTRKNGPTSRAVGSISNTDEGTDSDSDRIDRADARSEKTVKNTAKLKNDVKNWCDGRFFNYTVRPSFYSCLTFFDEILTHPTGSKKMLNFIKYQKIFTQQVWRENLVEVVRDRSHLREVQPYLDWNSLENSTDFALNYYRTFVDETLRLPRKVPETEKIDGEDDFSATHSKRPEAEKASPESAKNAKKKATSRNEVDPKSRPKARKDEHVRRRGENSTRFSDPRPNVEELYTPAVSETLRKLENGEEVGGENFFARILNFEVILERLKKMTKIFPFTKGSFPIEICDRMTLYQDKCIIYEQEKKMEISDLNRCLDLLRESEGELREANSVANTEEEERKKSRLEGSRIPSLGLTDDDDEPAAKNENESAIWDENLGCFAYDIVHESVLNESRKNQRVVKNLLLKIIAHSASFEESRKIPRCLSSTFEPAEDLGALPGVSKKHADMIEYLKDDDTDVNEEVVKHYLVYTIAELKDFKEEHAVPRETRDFLWKFATRYLKKKEGGATAVGPRDRDRDGSRWRLSEKETEKALTEHLGEEGLRVFYDLEQLYPDKMKPKSINDILENTSVRTFSNLYFLFRSVVFANSISLIPVESTVEKKTHEAMKRKRYEILEDQEDLPESAYDVYLTKCCNKITTPTSYGSYGQYGLSYDHGLSAIVCNRKSKKRAFSNAFEDRGKTFEDRGKTFEDRGKTFEDRGKKDSRLDFDLERDETTDIEGGPSIRTSSSPAASRGRGRGRGRGRTGTGRSETRGNRAATVKKSTEDAENMFDFSRSRECDGKTKFKIAKRIKRLRETASCFNSEAMKFNIRGYVLVRRTRGKSPKVYGHCPGCAQFHVVSPNGSYGLGGYACERCRRVTPENYLVGECRKCGAQVFDEQIGRSVKLPVVDVNDHENPIKRLIWCKHHGPKNFSRFSARPSATKRTTNKRAAEAVKWVSSYDTEIRAPTFLDAFERKPLRKKTKYGNIFGRDENEKKTMDQMDKEFALAGFKSSLASLGK